MGATLWVLHETGPRGHLKRLTPPYSHLGFKTGVLGGGGAGGWAGGKTPAFQMGLSVGFLDPPSVPPTAPSSRDDRRANVSSSRLARGRPLSSPRAGSTWPGRSTPLRSRRRTLCPEKRHVAPGDPGTLAPRCSGDPWPERRRRAGSRASSSRAQKAPDSVRTGQEKGPCSVSADPRPWAREGRVEDACASLCSFHRRRGRERKAATREAGHGQPGPRGGRGGQRFPSCLSVPLELCRCLKYLRNKAKSTGTDRSPKRNPRGSERAQLRFQRT